MKHKPDVFTPISFLIILSFLATILIHLVFVDWNVYLVNAYSSVKFSQINQPIIESNINKQSYKLLTNNIDNIHYYNDISHIINVTNNSTNSSSYEDLIDSNDQLQKIQVGDIDIAYKSFGNGQPIILISGSGNVMDVWPQYLLQKLASSYQVIIFDNRGVGNTSTGTKPFSIEQFANDTAGLMDALKIPRADILGFSMGSFVAQQLTLLHPEKVNRLILYGASCGGQENIPQNPSVIKVLSDFVNNRSADANSFLAITFPLDWIENNPNFLKSIPTSKEIILSTTLKKQFDLNEHWLSKDWTGICDEIRKITQPTLIITGTKDVAVPSKNSLILANKIPGAWLVQFDEAGHGLMYQYPKEFTNLVDTFLKVTDKFQ